MTNKHIETYTCDHCGETYNITHLNLIETQNDMPLTLCDNCLHDHYFFCDKCQQWHHKEYYPYGDDLLGHIWNNDNIHQFSGYKVFEDGIHKNVCKKCLNRYYMECCECGNFFNEDDLEFYYGNFGHGYVCKACKKELDLSENSAV